MSTHAEIVREAMRTKKVEPTELEKVQAQRDALLKAAKGLLAEYENSVPDVALRIQYRQQLRAAIAAAESNQQAA